MSIKVYIRQGDSTDTADDADITTDAPMFDGNTSLMELGGKYSNGEASTGDVVVLDKTGLTFISPGSKVLGSGCLTTVTEDAAGCAYWLHRGRKRGHTQGRGARVGGNNAEWQVHSDDGNWELAGQPFTEDWVRGAETGYARLVALQAYTLNGTASTSPHHRETCEVVVLDSHFCKNANSVTMPAKTYPIGTEPREVVEDCATTEGKDYGVVRHHSGGFPSSTTYEHWTWEAGNEPIAHPYGGAGNAFGASRTQDVYAGAGANGTSWCSRAIGTTNSGKVVAVAAQSYDFDFWTSGYGESWPCIGHGLINWSAGVKWYDSSDTLLRTDTIASHTAQPQDGPFKHDSATLVAPTSTAYFQLDHNTAGLGCEQGSIFWDEVTIRTGSDSGCSHLCLQYIVPADLTTNPSLVKISDQHADWNPDDLTAPVLEPIWNQGPATIGDSTDLSSAIVLRWGTDNATAIFTEDTGRTDRNDYWAFAFDDPDSVNSTQAGLRASALLSTRTSEHYTHQPTLIMRADQIHLVVEGMAIQLKSAAAAAGSNLGDYITRRIAEVKYAPLSPEIGRRLTGTLVPLYRVALNLDRPAIKARLGKGQLQSKAGTPHSATELPYTPPNGSGSTSTNVQVQLDALEQAPTVKFLTNKSGGSVIAGDVVVVDTGNNDSFTTTTSASETRVIGVAQATIANNASGAVALGGYVALVNTTASVTRGHYAFTSTTVKKASGSASRAAGAFAQFLTGGTTPDAILFGVPDAAGAGLPSSGTKREYLGNTSVGVPAWIHGKFNPRAYGCVMDGTTDDLTAWNAMMSEVISAGGGEIWIPEGDLKLSTMPTALSVPSIIRGSGSMSFDGTAYGSRITLVSGSVDLFSVTAKEAVFADIGLFSNSGGTPSAGAAVHPAGTYLEQKVDFDNVHSRGFYDGLDVQVGAQWSMVNVLVTAPVRYGVRIRNTVNADAGDWSIVNSNIYADAYNATSGIRIESSGGGKIVNTKTNMALSGNRFTHGIDLAVAGSVTTADLLIANCSIENVTGDGIHGTTTAGTSTWKNIHIVDVQVALYSSNTTGHAVNLVATTASDFAKVLISHMTVAGDGSSGNAGAAISLTKVDKAWITAIINEDFGSILSTTTCTNITDETVPATSLSFATPAIALGSSAAAGAAGTVIRSDSTIAAFDGTAPVTQAFSDTAATGSAAVAARRDHKHGMPASPGTGSGVSACLATRTSSLSISANPTALALNATDLYDPDGWHDPSSNNNRFTCPTGKGGKMFVMSWSLEFDTATGGTAYVTIKKNVGATVVAQSPLWPYFTYGGAAPVYLDDGDYVEVTITNRTTGSIIQTDAPTTFGIMG